MNGDGGGVNERARVIRGSSGGIGIVAAGALRPFCLCHASMFRSCNLASSPAPPPLRAPRSRHAARPPTHPPPASCAMAFARPHPALDFWSRAAHGDSSTTTSSRSEVNRLRYACRGGGRGGGAARNSARRCVSWQACGGRAAGEGLHRLWQHFLERQCGMPHHPASFASQDGAVRGGVPRRANSGQQQ